MIHTIRGRVIKLGDRVNTDIIAPGRWKSETMEVLKIHTMEAVRPGFSDLVRPGDILVAGRDFGCGSHREQATQVMQAMGISAIAADSVARLYFRNGIAFGLLVIAAEQVSSFVREGDEMEIEMGEEAITLTNRTAGTAICAPPLPPVMRRVLEAGGIYEYLKGRY